MNRRQFTATLGAAVAGLVAGKTLLADDKPADKPAKHACKGMNECKGQGGCNTKENSCAGQNACKGKGGCATAAKHDCAGKNECKGQGGCKPPATTSAPARTRARARAAAVFPVKHAEKKDDGSKKS